MPRVHIALGKELAESSKQYICPCTCCTPRERERVADDPVLYIHMDCMHIAICENIPSIITRYALVVQNRDVASFPGLPLPALLSLLFLSLHTRVYSFFFPLIMSIISGVGEGEAGGATPPPPPTFENGGALPPPHSWT